MLLLKFFLCQPCPCLRHSDPSSHFGNHIAKMRHTLPDLLMREVSDLRCLMGEARHRAWKQKPFSAVKRENCPTVNWIVWAAIQQVKFKVPIWDIYDFFTESL